jgi:hypothetical protein
MLNTGGPFWMNKKQWLEIEPTFNVDRVQTPLLIHDDGTDFSSAALDVIGVSPTALCRDSLIGFPTGFGILQAPDQLRGAHNAISHLPIFLSGCNDPDPGQWLSTI